MILDKYSCCLLIISNHLDIGICSYAELGTHNLKIKLNLQKLIKLSKNKIICESILLSPTK